MLLPGRSAYFNRLNLEADLDLVSDYHASRFQRLIPGEPKLAAIDLPSRAESNALPTPRILGLALELDIERDWPGYITDRKISAKLEIRLVTLNQGAAEAYLRILLSIQEIRRPQVLVSLVGPSIQAHGFKCRFDGRILRVLLIGIDDSFDICDPALYSRDHQLLGVEFDDAVRRITLLRCLGSPCGW